MTSTACAQASAKLTSAPPVTRDRQPAATIDGRYERQLLNETHGRGTLVEIHAGAADNVTNILVHGMPGAASSLSSVIRPAIDADETVTVFVYDNKFRSLEDSSRDLARAIGAWMDDHRDRPLRIAAHSAGGRVTLAALSVLASDDRLNGEIEVNLIASPIAGVRSAMFARWAPGFLPWIRPLRGISPRSRVQTVIDRLQLPDNVKVRVFVGGKDSVFKHSTKRYGDLVARLHATLSVFANATHTTILDEIAHLSEAPDWRQ